MSKRRVHRVLVTGATGFIGRALRPALLAAGYEVRATTRRLRELLRTGREQWAVCDLEAPAAELAPVLEGVDAAFYLVHSMEGATGGDYAVRERRAAQAFARAAADAGLERVVYLGGVLPGREAGEPSPHLASRGTVGAVLRGAGGVPALELRASMVVGPGSASWQLCRDVALRLPVVPLPTWLRARTCPIAVEDVVQALVDGLTVPLPRSAWYDIPGPDVLSARDILQRIAALGGRRLPALEVPMLPPGLLPLQPFRLLTRTDPSLARELLKGLRQDLLPRDGRYWELTGHPPRLSFDEAARRALAAEPPGSGPLSLASVGERLLQWLGGALPPLGAPR
jgi:uncharacterized protein YbjT (DUF2867 family)